MPTGTSNNATATIISSAGNASFNLSGTGLTGILSAPKSFAISVKTGQTTHKTLTIKNAGKGMLSGSWTAVTTLPYGVTAGLFGPLGPGKTAPPITVNFSPTTKGNAAPVGLVFSVNPPGTGGTTVMLQGIGK